MAITLGEQQLSISRVLSGKDYFVVAAGKTLKIETSPDGVTILDEVVPESKQWAVYIDVRIEESSA